MFGFNFDEDLTEYVDEFTFGQYTGLSVEDVVEMDYGYILFLSEKNVNFRQKITDRAKELRMKNIQEFNYREDELPF